MKTSTKFRTLDPVWNEEEEVPEYEIGDVITFTVFDNDFGHSDDFLGSATVTSGMLTNTGYEGTLTLEEAGVIGASLAVKIELTAPEKP